LNAHEEIPIPRGAQIRLQQNTEGKGGKYKARNFYLHLPHTDKRVRVPVEEDRPRSIAGSPSLLSVDINTRKA